MNRLDYNYATTYVLQMISYFTLFKLLNHGIKQEFMDFCAAAK